MFHPTVTVVIPTLNAGPTLLECLGALSAQTRTDFEVLIVDNSGRSLVRSSEAGRLGACVIEAPENLGFGGAVNEGVRRSRAPFVAVLNDDAIVHPGWLAALLEAIESHPDAGSCASQVRLLGGDLLDSAGMLIAGDGSSKQRGHRQPPSRYPDLEEVLCPSGAAALYRRAMLDQVGWFDDRFFLYCEDTDLGLRAQRAGWKCLYVPQAVVEHHYSMTAGDASPLKAYYVERNRLLVAAKNFPARRLIAVPVFELRRYFWHLVAALGARGSAGRFRAGGGGVLELAYIAVRAHFAVVALAGHVWKQRRAIRARARLGAAEFSRLLRRYSITPREVAAQ